MTLADLLDAIESEPILRHASAEAKEKFARSILSAQRRITKDVAADRKRAESRRYCRRMFGLQLNGLSFVKIGRRYNRSASAVTQSANKFVRRWLRASSKTKGPIEGDTWKTGWAMSYATDYRVKH